MARLEVSEVDIHPEWRIVRNFQLMDFLGDAMPDHDDRVRLTEAVSSLCKAGARVEVGGRRLREMMGCKVYDFARYVESDLENLEHIQRCRLWPVLSLLGEFPAERMRNPIETFSTGI